MHLDHIRKVLQVLREQKLYTKKSKCVFGSQEVDYLMFIIKPSCVAIDPHKAKAIEAYFFLGLVSYYRRYIRHCSGIAKPLTELTKNFPFVRSNNAEDVFRTLKQKVNTAPVLRLFHQDYPGIVTTDA